MSYADLYLSHLAVEVLDLTTRSGLTVAEALAQAAERGATREEAEAIVREALTDEAIDAQWEREAAELGDVLFRRAVLE